MIFSSRCAARRGIFVLRSQAGGTPKNCFAASRNAPAQILCEFPRTSQIVLTHKWGSLILASVNAFRLAPRPTPSPRPNTRPTATPKEPNQIADCALCHLPQHRSGQRLGDSSARRQQHVNDGRNAEVPVSPHAQQSTRRLRPSAELGSHPRLKTFTTTPTASPWPQSAAPHPACSPLLI